MKNFSIGKQIETELEDFRNKQVRLAFFNENSKSSVRYAKGDQDAGYYFNQANMISLIDLYYNSKFDGSYKDNQGQRKIFLNVGKFRTDVSAKQIDIDTKDFKFTPDDYADPWTAIFLQKDFGEWAKDSDWGELINQCVDNFPKYGTIVLKKVGNEIKWVPLQNLRNEQTATDLNCASYVIEEHPDMYLYEMQDMKQWDTDGFNLRWGETANVFERYGRVPLSWLKAVDKSDRAIIVGDEGKSVDAMVVTAKDATGAYKILYAGECKKRPYREAHWNKQHGRWLGCGVMEDLLENQRAKNIIVNLIKRGIGWMTKKFFKTNRDELVEKNLVKDVPDGGILDLGPNGTLEEVVLSAKSNGDFSNFLNEFEKNSDQKAFTYEVATGESLPGGTPFRLGVVLSNAVNSYFNKKRENLGMFLKKVIVDFMIPQFLRDMSDIEKVMQFFSGEPGFEVLKQATIDFIKSEATRISILNGKAVDMGALESIASPYYQATRLMFKVKGNTYKVAKSKFDFDVTGEASNVDTKIQSLSSIYQLLAGRGDPRAESVLEHIANLSGNTMAQFGPKPQAVAPQAPQPNLPQGSVPELPKPKNEFNTATA